MNKTVKTLLIAATHVLALGFGFALGIYTLPILTAPDGPDAAVVKTTANSAQFTGEFRRDLQDLAAVDEERLTRIGSGDNLEEHWFDDPFLVT